jgi:hypothetical protein
MQVAEVFRILAAKIANWLWNLLLGRTLRDLPQLRKVFLAYGWQFLYDINLNVLCRLPLDLRAL